jgi:ABC-2 type transport system permease protein
MNRLFLAELNRLRSRRLTWIAIILVVLAIGLTQLAVAQAVKPLTATELAQGQAQYQEALRDYEANKADYEQSEQQCRDDGNPPEDCQFKPIPENYASRSVVAFDEITNVAITVAVFVTTLTFLLIGASFIGAEYSSGALGNWLSFIPERGKVFASKLLALVAAAAVVTALASAVTIGLSALVARVVGADVVGLTKLVEMGGRGVAIGVIGGVLGFVLALVTRHTIAAGATVLGYLLVTWVVAAFAYSIEWLQKLKPWLPEYNVLAFLNHGYEYQVYVNTVTAQGLEQTSVDRTISFAHSAGYWSVIVVVVVGLAYLVFRRRDVN